VQIIEVTDAGVRSTVIRLGRDGSPLRFVVYPMLHMGQSGFYAEVAARLGRAQVVVAEGTGRGGVASSALMTALARSHRAPRRGGLVEQDIDYDALGVPVLRPDLDHDGGARAPLRRRIGASGLRPLITVGRLVGGTRALWSRAAGAHTGDDESARRLLATLERLHEERSAEPIEVAVVYGAGSVSAVIDGLGSRYGYRAEALDLLTVVTLVDDVPEPTRIPDPEADLDTFATPVPDEPAEEPVDTPADPLAAAADEVLRLRAEGSPGALGSALVEYANHLLRVERHDDAQTALTEAVALGDTEAPDELTRQAAVAWRSLAQARRRTGRPGEALDASTQAVRTARRRLRRSPDDIGLLADSLASLAWSYRSLGRVDDAVATAEEVVAGARAHAERSGAAGTAVLATCLSKLADMLDWASRRRSELRGDLVVAAVEAATEAVDLWRELVATHPQARSDLSAAGGRLAYLRWKSHVDDRGLASAAEAESIARALVAEDPDRHRKLLVDVLTDVWRSYLAAGQDARALEATQDAVRHARIAARRQPGAGVDLPFALDERAVLLRSIDRPAEAAAADDEAQRLRAPSR
jgi:tetratricopeptide (TPR) repeat protein